MKFFKKQKGTGAFACNISMKSSRKTPVRSSKSISSQNPASVLLYFFGFFFLAFTSVQFANFLNNPFFSLGLYLIALISLIFTFAVPIAYIIHRAKASRQAAALAIPKTEKPAEPARKKPRRIPAAYQERLNTLSSMCEEMQERSLTINSFLSDYFENSVISISRFQNVMGQAQEALLENFNKAVQAAAMFGSGEPTPDRLRILDGYVNDSAEIVAKMESIIDEMTKLQQERLFDDTEPIDEMLDSLSKTTHQYSQK